MKPGRSLHAFWVDVTHSLFLFSSLLSPLLASHLSSFISHLFLSHVSLHFSLFLSHLSSLLSSPLGLFVSSILISLSLSLLLFFVSVFSFPLRVTFRSTSPSSLSSSSSPPCLFACLLVCLFVCLFVCLLIWMWCVWNFLSWIENIMKYINSYVRPLIDFSSLSRISPSCSRHFWHFSFPSFFGFFSCHSSLLMRAMLRFSVALIVSLLLSHDSIRFLCFFLFSRQQAFSAVAIWGLTFFDAASEALSLLEARGFSMRWKKKEQQRMRRRRRKRKRILYACHHLSPFFVYLVVLFSQHFIVRFDFFASFFFCVLLPCCFLLVLSVSFFVILQRLLSTIRYKSFFFIRPFFAALALLSLFVFPRSNSFFSFPFVSFLAVCLRFFLCSCFLLSGDAVHLNWFLIQPHLTDFHLAIVCFLWPFSLLFLCVLLLFLSPRLQVRCSSSVLFLVGWWCAALLPFVASSSSTCLLSHFWFGALSVSWPDFV